MSSKVQSIFRFVMAGSVLSVIALSAIGVREWRTSSQCKAAWEHAGERAGDRLTDPAATPYLGMILASKHEVPASYAIARRDFISACRAGAIWQVAPRDEAGRYLQPTPIAGRRQTTPATAN